METGDIALPICSHYEVNAVLNIVSQVNVLNSSRLAFEVCSKKKKLKEKFDSIWWRKYRSRKGSGGYNDTIWIVWKRWVNNFQIKKKSHYTMGIFTCLNFLKIISVHCFLDHNMKVLPLDFNHIHELRINKLQNALNCIF